MNRNRLAMLMAYVVVLLFSALAQAQNRLPIEATMRELQARWKEISHQTPGAGAGRRFDALNQPAIVWEGQEFPTLQDRTPEYPPDGLYDNVTVPPPGVIDLFLVQKLAAFWYGVQPCTYFIKENPDDVGCYNWIIGSTDDAMHMHTLLDFQELNSAANYQSGILWTEANVTLTNYPTVFEKLTAAILQLNTFFRDMGDTGLIEVGPNDPLPSSRIEGLGIYKAQAATPANSTFGTCSDATQALKGLLDHHAQYAGRNRASLISVSELLHVSVNDESNPTEYRAEGMLYLRTGRLVVNAETADHRPHDGHGYIYLRVFENPDGLSYAPGFEPPVTPVRMNDTSNPDYFKLCRWRGDIPIGRVGSYSVFNTGGEPNLDSFVLTNTYCPTVDQSVCLWGARSTDRGWTLGNYNCEDYQGRSDWRPFMGFIMKITHFSTDPSGKQLSLHLPRLKRPGAGLLALWDANFHLPGWAQKLLDKVGQTLRDWFDDFFDWLFGWLWGGHHTPSPPPPKDPKTCDPVNLSRGDKSEQVVDVEVPLAGGSFVIERGYYSKPGIYSTAGYGLVGANWNLSIFQSLSAEDDGAGHTIIRLGDVDSGREVVFYPVTGVTGEWRPSGPSQQSIHQATLQVNGHSVGVWRLEHPGGGEIDFYRLDSSSTIDSSLDGWIAAQRDTYGNEHRFNYTVYGVDDDPNSQTARLASIDLNYSATRGYPDARIALEWNVTANTAACGRLAKLTVERTTAQETYKTDVVEYLYKDAQIGLSADLGTAGDLIQVTKRVRMNATRLDWSQSGDSLLESFHTTVTQYRYHDGQTHTNQDERLALFGAEHQLKLYFEPEQVEWLAEKSLAFDVDSAAVSLLQLSDGDLPYAGATQGTKLIDYATKLVSYEPASSHRVATQYLKTGCGCSAGSTHGVKMLYAYGQGALGPTCTISESILDGTAWTPYRTQFYDMETRTPSGAAYLRTSSETEVASGRTWTWKYTFDSHGNMLTMQSPAACADSSGNSGLVYRYAYNDDNRVTQVSFSNGINGSPALIARATYTDFGTTGHRLYLPTRLERFRTASSSPTDAETETTDFSYGFFQDSTAIAWMRTAKERETCDENGPDTPGTCDAVSLYNPQGQMEWTRDPGESLVHRVFEANTGAVAGITTNADPSAIQSSLYTGLSISGWGIDPSTGQRWTGGELTATFVLDKLGRRIASTGPDGSTSYIRRELRTIATDSRLLHYTLVTLPSVATESPTTVSGPASLSWISAGGKVLQFSTFSLSPEVGYDPTDGSYTIKSDDVGPIELSRVATVFSPMGVETGSKAWTNVRGDQFEEWHQDHDVLGRVTQTTAPSGSTTTYDYDFFDRVIQVSRGTSTTAAVPVAMVVYDGVDPNQTPPAPGVGNGLPTFMRYYSGEGSLGPATTDLRISYDWRDRATSLVGPVSPYPAVAYDNLGRVTREALFDTPPTNGVDSSGRLSYETVDYNQRGLIYRTSKAIDPGSTTPQSFLHSDVWYDAVGHVIAELGPGAPSSKLKYDGHGRLIAQYVSDHGGDPTPGTQGNYTGASSLTGDMVLSQKEYQYSQDPAFWRGRLSLVTSRQRLHDDTSTTGPLIGSSAITGYVGQYYDHAGRPTRTVVFGTNTADGSFSMNGPAPTWPPAQEPEPGVGPALISGVAYGERGFADHFIDSAGRQSMLVVDDLARVVATIENAVIPSQITSPISWDGQRWATAQGLLDPAHPDRNRVSSFVYDSAGHLFERVAHAPGAQSTDPEVRQVTRFIYGVTADSASTDTNSLISSNDAVREVRYPDESTGLPADTDPSHAHTVSYAYDRLGGLRSVVDQINVKHTYLKDAGNRVVTDQATIPSGMGIDTQVDRITSAFNSIGLPSTVSSWNGSTVVNQVAFDYNTLGQLEKLWEDVDGPVQQSGGVPSGNTALVQYSYTTNATQNLTRLSAITYPDSTSLGYEYGGTGSVNDRIDRIESLLLSPHAADPIKLVQYEYLGLAAPVSVDYQAIDVQLDYTLSASGQRRTHGYTTGDKGVYPGFDQFGRVLRHAWADGKLSIYSTTSSLAIPNKPPIFSEVRTYDLASNVLTKTDGRPGASFNDRDWKYTYDGLNRLTEAQRGHFKDPQTFSFGPGSMQWSYDMLGNWTGVRTDAGGDGVYGNQHQVPDGAEDLDETRDHNKANQITARYPDTGLPSLPFAYDHTGNTTSMKRDAGPTRGTTYDAWGRLIYSQDVTTGNPMGVAPLTGNSYNGLHWRVKAQEGIGNIHQMYYSASWQMIEEHVYSSDEGVQTHLYDIEQFWGLRSINDPVARRLIPAPNPSGSNPPDPRLYFHLTDPLFSTVAMLDDTGRIAERVSYDAYGRAKHRWPGDFNGIEGFNSKDRDMLVQADGHAIGDDKYNADMDLDRDGKIDFDADIGAAGKFAGPLDDEFISDPNGPANTIGFAGYNFDKLTRWYDARFRWYAPGYGRWMSRDPLAGANGWNPYQYVGGNPFLIDPLGLCGGDEDPWTYIKAAAGDFNITNNILDNLEGIDGVWDRLTGLDDAKQGAWESAMRSSEISALGAARRNVNDPMPGRTSAQIQLAYGEGMSMSHAQSGTVRVLADTNIRMGESALVMGGTSLLAEGAFAALSTRTAQAFVTSTALQVGASNLPVVGALEGLGAAGGTGLGMTAPALSTGLSAGGGLGVAALADLADGTTAGARAAMEAGGPIAADGCPCLGSSLRRVWGGESGPFGKSWTQDPANLLTRNRLGVETQNTAEFMSHATVTDNTGMLSKGADPWGRFNGWGGNETLVEHADSQLQLDAVTMRDGGFPWSRPTDPWPFKRP